MFVSASRGAARVVELVDAPGSARIPGGEKSPCGFESRPGQSSLMADAQLPNKRLKLSGALVLTEAIECGPGGRRTSSTTSFAGARGARSLSAVR